VASPSAGKVDTTYVMPTASVIISARPAQFLAAPMAQLLPVEVAAAAGLAYAGFDPADVDEVVVFGDLSNLAMPAYGAAIKFNKPFRGSSIPPHLRPAVQLSELAGRKYLQSSHPLFPSFYGTNAQTLILAPDAVLRQMVESAGQSKVGPLIDRVREVPSSYDLYVAVDVASLRPRIQKSLSQAPAAMPPEMKPLLGLPNLIAAAELTFNLSSPGPSSLVIHANDETAAQQIEILIAEAKQKYQPPAAAEQPPIEGPIQQAMAIYKERMARPFQPQRNGASITLVQIDGQDPAQQQMTAIPVLAAVAAVLLTPAIQAAREAALRAQQGQATPPMAPPTADGAESSETTPPDPSEPGTDSPAPERR